MEQGQYDIVMREFTRVYEKRPTVIASAPGRLEVLGNHTDYNQGLALSCAVNFRCSAAIAAADAPEMQLASTAYQTIPQVFALDNLVAPKGHWANYVLGLVSSLCERGYPVPGFDLLVASTVPPSAGVSSSAALEMAALKALVGMMDLDLSPLELARIGQSAESAAVGAQTGLLDQLTSLEGVRDHLLLTDFQTLQTQTLSLPQGWCLVAVDSGVKHDLTVEYNQRRKSCEIAANMMGVTTLREMDEALLESSRDSMPEESYRCALHVLGENRRVLQATDALAKGDILELGGLMFASHASSRDNFRNSCPQLDALVAFAQADERCVGARLSGGGFGGITIHLVRQADAEGYLKALLGSLPSTSAAERWSAICKTDDGASFFRV